MTTGDSSHHGWVLWADCVSPKIGGNLPLTLKAYVGFGDSVCKYFNCFTISQNPPFLQAKVIVFQAKRERQEYRSIGTASTHVWKINKNWRLYVFKKRMLLNIPEHTIIFIPKKKKLKKINKNLIWTFLLIILVSVQHAKGIKVLWCKNSCQHLKAKEWQPTAKGLFTADPKELNSATCLCCMQYKSKCLFYFFSICPNKISLVLLINTFLGS
jgi:hypothetical protein